MLTVHHLNLSRSKRVLWLLEELGCEFELVKHQRDKTTRLAPDTLKAIHPLSKAPVIVDGEFTLCESSTICEYILNTYGQGRLRPSIDAPEYYAYLEWSHFAEGSLAMPVITKMFMQMEDRKGDQPMDGYIGKEIALDFSYIEATLTQRAYFAGDEFSAADIMMTIVLEMAANIGLLTEQKNTLAYLTKMQAREAYVKAASHG